MGRMFGDGSTDYEKYVRTQDLYRAIKDPAQWANEDECLFQVTHMSMELWLSVVIQHLEQATAWMNEGRLRDAGRFLMRGANIVEMLLGSLRHLEAMSPWNYHAIRVTLGKGSGQQSPTFNQLLAQPKPVLAAYNKVLASRKLSVDDIQQNPVKHDELYQLTAAMLTFDENFMRWRYGHFQLVKRIIGDGVLSLKGVPASALKDYAHEAAFPDLWACINRTTQAYNEKHGAPGLSGGYVVVDEKAAGKQSKKAK